MSSNPARVKIKTPLARKATGDPLIKSISLEKTQSSSLVAATLEVKNAMHQINDRLNQQFRAFRRAKHTRQIWWAHRTSDVTRELIP